MRSLWSRAGILQSRDERFREMADSVGWQIPWDGRFREMTDSVG